MQENNLYRNLDKQSSASIVFNLFSRHDGMASIYRQVATDVKEASLKSWFSSLADYRQTLADELRQIVDNNGSIPQKGNQEMKPFLKMHEDKLTNYIIQKNDVGLISLSLEAEEEVAKYFQKAEGNKNIPIKIRQQLEDQHRRTSAVIAKARRLKIVPSDQDLSFQLE